MARLFLNTKDVMVLTGLTVTPAKLRLSAVRARYGIPKYKPVTVVQFSDFYGLDVRLVLEQIGH
ncbi:hypothetical protein [Pedobacter sp. JY14-1]|uniref:hypothetical protein n=1 Tax=Pedobacter sp. JY14-1 TaxID=3034151 RepID=UPI0023E30828|nr:hypothetical protein [Pedobacter sp. JY14-1]